MSVHCDVCGFEFDGSVFTRCPLCWFVADDTIPILAIMVIEVFELPPVNPAIDETEDDQPTKEGNS